MFGTKSSANRPTWFQSVREASPITSGLYFLPLAATISPSAIVQGIIVAKTGQYRFLVRYACIWFTIIVIHFVTPLDLYGLEYLADWSRAFDLHARNYRNRSYSRFSIDHGTGYGTSILDNSKYQKPFCIFRCPHPAFEFDSLQSWLLLNYRKMLLLYLC